MSLQMRRLEPIVDRNLKAPKKPYKNPVVHEPGGWYIQAATKLLWSDLKDSIILSNVVKPGGENTMRVGFSTQKQPHHFVQYTSTFG